MAKPLTFTLTLAGLYDEGSGHVARTIVKHVCPERTDELVEYLEETARG